MLKIAHAVGTTLMAPAKADELAKTLNADSDGSETFVACHCSKGTGQSFVKVLVDGEEVARI